MLSENMIDNDIKYNENLWRIRRNISQYVDKADSRFIQGTFLKNSEKAF